MDLNTTPVNRRHVLGGILGLGALAGLSACGGSSSSSTSSTSSSTATDAASAAATTSAAATAASASGSASSDASAFPTLASLKPLASKFTQATYTDSSTGKSLPYNVFLPEGYSTSKKYPLVLYIADARYPGKAVTAPLVEYGALIWASAADKAKHPSIVIVPEYPEVILDDNSGSHTTTDHVELTGRFVTWLKTKYSVDTTRVYGTGQSMGCMTCLYLAGKYTDMFAAELFVSGQWDGSVLTKLTQTKFFYIAAGGDEKSTGGQADVENLLKKNDVPFQTATWDATWTAAQFADATQKIFAAGDRNNFATFKAGTVMTANPSSGGMEHLASFEPAYKITGLRDWLFAQSAWGTPAHGSGPTMISSGPSPCRTHPPMPSDGSSIVRTSFPRAPVRSCCLRRPTKGPAPASPDAVPVGSPEPAGPVLRSPDRIPSAVPPNRLGDINHAGCEH